MDWYGRMHIIRKGKGDAYMSFYIVKHDGIVHQIIDEDGRPNKYGNPKIFKNMIDAQKWILKHTYKGMSHSYEVKEVNNA